MSRVLMIFEIPGKQRYIFGSNALQENVERSLNIAYLMNEYADREFFRDIAEERFPENPARFYDRARNLVYSGGGHTILQFDAETPEAARETAKAFGEVVTWEAMRRFPGVEMFVKLIDYDETAAPGENLRRLHRELEQKKARRQAAFRRTTLGVERLGAEFSAAERPEGRRNLSFSPVPVVRPSDGMPPERKKERFPFEIRPPEGFAFPLNFADLADETGFIAVVHIDGNGMGNRSNALNSRADAEDWAAFRALRQRFTESVKESYRAALECTMDALKPEADTEAKWNGKPFLPLRPVILAGDDVCFVSAGNLGLECARVFLEFLACQAENTEDGMPYPACAGVVLVHKNYPFHRAYDLAEELCSNAKKYGVRLDGSGGVSAMDWHIEFGQLKDGLDAQREDYRTEDGNRLELRPVTVCVPDETVLDERQRPRTWKFFREMCRNMQADATARGKIKGLRNALKQGEVESAFYLRMNQAEDLLAHTFVSLYPREEERHAVYQKVFAGEAPEIFQGKFQAHLPAFADTDGGKRSLLFDSVEMMDHCRFLEEG